MLALALGLVTAMAAQQKSVPGTGAELVRLLDGTVWIDVGLGRTLASLTPKQIAELRRCKEPTMAFEKTSAGWVQSFYAGIEMRTVYGSAAFRRDTSVETVLFYATGGTRPAEVLRLTKAGDAMVEQTRGFRPHTFLKCNPPRPARKAK